MTELKVPRWWRTHDDESDWTNGVGRRAGRRRSDDRCRTGSQGQTRCATRRAKGGARTTSGPGRAACRASAGATRHAPCRGTAGRATAGRKTASCKTTSPKAANVGTARCAPGAKHAEAKFCGSSTPSGTCSGQPQCSTAAAPRSTRAAYPATAAPSSARAAHPATAAACRTPASARAGRAVKAKRAERANQDKRAECTGEDKSADAAAATTQYTATVAG